MNPDPSIDPVLARLLLGEADAGELSVLAENAALDSRVAKVIADELAFSELLRQALAPNADEFPSHFEGSLASAGLQIEELLFRVREGTATRFECDQVVKYFWESPEALRHFQSELAEDEWLRESLSKPKGEDAFVESLATRMWAETRQDHFVDDFTKRLERELAPMDEGAQDAENIIPVDFGWTRTLLRMGALAASIAIGSYYAGHLAASLIRDSSSVASVVKSSSDASWSIGSAPGSDGAISSGLYQLDRGVVSLRMSSGSELTVEGPALFEVGYDSSTFVHAGIALARVPENDLGI